MDFDRDIVAVYFDLIKIAKRHYYRDDDDRAYDLAAEAVCRAIEARDRYDGRRPLLTWCRAIMRNLWRNQEQLLVTTHTARLGDWDEPGGLEPELLAMVREVLDIITEWQHKSVSVATLMEFARGYSVAEIATKRGIPQSTVKRRVHDARKMLIKFLNVN